MVIKHTKPDWKAVHARRKYDIDSKIPKEWCLPSALIKVDKVLDIPYESNILTARELHLTEARAVDLVQALQTGICTSVEVTTAFCKRAAIAHQLTNCLAVVRFDEALADAAELDEYMRRHGKPKGPLHGLPISVKEHIYLDGTTATSALIAWADDTSPGDALIVKVLREAGAVFHVKTTNPQCLMSLECDSNLFGRTTNPHNRNLTPGGSSGGEAALIAMRGSPLGIGTDIGGSIRAPSAFSGGYGLKPSVARLPHGGLSGIHGGMENIVGAVGPMANSVDDLKLFCNVVLSANPWDHEPSLIEIPWRSISLPERLKVAVMWDDGVVLPHPPVRRALQETVKALRSNGHTIVQWSPKYHKELVQWANRAYLLDAGREYTDTMKLGNEPAVPSLKYFLSLAGSSCSIEDTWKINSERDRLRTLWAAQWRELGINALICPAHASVASAHDECHYWGYTSVFNSLDLSAAVMPVGTVRNTDTWDIYPATVPSMGTIDDEYRQQYNPGKYKEAPISLQVVTTRLQEERLLEVISVVDAAVNKRGQASNSSTISVDISSTEGWKLDNPVEGIRTAA